MRSLGKKEQTEKKEAQREEKDTPKPKAHTTLVLTTRGKGSEPPNLPTFSPVLRHWFVYLFVFVFRSKPCEEEAGKSEPAQETPDRFEVTHLPFL